MARASAGSPREEVQQAIAQQIAEMRLPEPPPVMPNSAAVERVGEMLRFEHATATKASIQAATRAYTQ